MSLSTLETPSRNRVNCGVHEQTVAPRLGMGPHHGVRHREELVVMAAVPLVAAPGLDVGREPRVVMPGDQLVAHGAHRRRQRVVGGLEAHPHGVAPDGGRLAHVQDRSERRRLEEGDVGVPPRGPVLSPVDVQDLGIALERRDHRVRRCHLPELTGEVGLDVGSEVLAGEEQHQMPTQRGTHLRHHVVAQGTARGRGPVSRPRCWASTALMSRPVVNVTPSMVPQRGGRHNPWRPWPTRARGSLAPVGPAYRVGPAYLVGTVAPVGPWAWTSTISTIEGDEGPRRADRAGAPPCLPGRRRPSRISCGHDGTG